MTPECWQQVKQIFQSALELHPGERSAFVALACGDDSLLRNEVESLISSHNQAGDSIEAMAGEATVPQTSPSDTQIRQCMQGMQCMHARFF